jgi:hypothetical protein
LRWLESWLEGSGGAPRATAAAREALAGFDRPWRIAVASPDEAVRHLAADGLEQLASDVHIERLATPDALTMALQRHEFDLVCLDVALDDAPLALASQLDAAIPRPAVLILHAATQPAGLRDSLEALTAVRGLVGLEEGDRSSRLIQAATRALAWVASRRETADQLFERGVAALGDQDPSNAATAFVAAYGTGDLAGAHRTALHAKLEATLPGLGINAQLLADLRRTALADRHDHLDEQGLIYHATSLREESPDAAGEAATWLGRADELAGRIYALIDEELEAAGVQRRLGNHAKVLTLAGGVLARLSNVLPAHQLRAEALRLTGRFDEAIDVYHGIAEWCLRDGEVERFYQVLRQIGALDLTGAQIERIANSRLRAQRLEEELSDPAALPRYPVLRVCSSALCREAAEGSRGFYATDPTVGSACDVCGILPARSEDRLALAGRTIAVVGVRLPGATTAALNELGVLHVICHDGIEDPAGVPGMIQAADAVVLVTGACSHAGMIKAYRELALRPRPWARVHFYGARQIARAASLDLAGKLRAIDVT